MWQTGGFLNTLMWFLLGYWVGIGMLYPLCHGVYLGIVYHDYQLLYR